MERQKEYPRWGYLFTADQDKSPQRFYTTDSQLDYAERAATITEEHLLGSLWMISIIDFVLIQA